MHNDQKTRIAVSRVFHLSDARRPEPDYAKPKNFYLTQKRHARYAYVTDATRLQRYDPLPLLVPREPDHCGMR